MKMSKKTLVFVATMAMGVSLVGCTAQKPPAPVVTAPAPVSVPAPAPVAAPEFKVFVGDKEATFTTIKKPHEHEKGAVYAPAEELGKALSAKVELSADKKTVKVNDKDVLAQTSDAKGIHDHDGVAFAPVKEFAAAAGYIANIDWDKHTVTFKK